MEKHCSSDNPALMPGQHNKTTAGGYNVIVNLIEKASRLGRKPVVPASNTM
jgi:hypothetical protein